MKPLFIEQTQSTLGVDFDPGKGVLSMRGESYPEDVHIFFSPVLEWLTDYVSGLERGRGVLVEMDIVYFNSSSSKALMNIFDILEDAARNNVDVRILWKHHVENEVARECGEEFAEDMEAAMFALAPYGDGR